MYCFSLFCRLCFRRDCKLLNLYTKDEDMITFSEKLKSCIPEIICDDDRIPNFICDTCCNKLRKGYEFKAMCVKNHIAMRDYAKQILKYIENPHTTLLNAKSTRDETESNESDPRDKTLSDHESDYSDEESLDPLDTQLNEPLALVKTDRHKDLQPVLPPENIKVENVDDDSYQCEDLTKKPIPNLEKFPEKTSEPVLPGRFLPRDIPGYNMTNDMVMKYLKIEYSDKEENRNHAVAPVTDHPENLCTADSETEQDESCSGTFTVREEPRKSKMKTRTKDKYRIVYTENQRLELEKEFIVSHYITTSRKIQLSASLKLSQRQIKIWFQNRRAKERKQVKRSAEQLGSDGAEMSCETPTNETVVPTKDVLPQILEVQNELFVLQRQQEGFKNQPSGTSNLDEVYKHKKELLNHRLQLLLLQQNELSNKQVETTH